MEQARLTAYYASLIHSTKSLKLNDFGIFPWEDELDFAPKFSKIDLEAFERFNAIQFPHTDN
jgi:hypothetical protein